MKEVTIAIAAQAGVGKTTLAQLIAKTLKTHGIACQVIDTEQEDLSQVSLDDRLAAVKGKAKVVIKTLQTNRHMSVKA